MFAKGPVLEDTTYFKINSVDYNTSFNLKDLRAS